MTETPASPSVVSVITRRAHDRSAYPHLARELATIDAMVHIWCRSHHGKAHELCGECADLMQYATRRLDRCVFGEEKPTCANCKVHCYNAAMRERIREVMRFAGPRMLWRHPLLALHHVVDKRREARQLPRKPPVPARDPSAGP
jgi:hypothetical protein